MDRADLSTAENLGTQTFGQLLQIQGFGAQSLIDVLMAVERTVQTGEATGRLLAGHPARDRPVADLSLSPGLGKRLERAGISTIGQLASRSAEQLRWITSLCLGILSLAEIRARLAELGLGLRGETPD